jgi:hypothetical protein
MKKSNQTEEQKAFKLEQRTLNKQFIYWMTKSRCVDWTLRETNDKYDKLRKENDHGTAMMIIQKEMFKNSLD